MSAEIGAANAQLRADQPLVLDASPAKGCCFPSAIEASPAVSRSHPEL
jgi:hypothetical protein